MKRKPKKKKLKPHQTLEHHMSLCVPLLMHDGEPIEKTIEHYEWIYEKQNKSDLK